MLGTAAGALILRNCIMTPITYPGAVYFTQIPAAGATITNSTVDLRVATSGGSKAVWGRTSSGTTVTIQNVAILSSVADNRALLTGLSNADTLNITNNAYQQTGPIVLSNNDGTTAANRTFAQWQALGKDAGSFTSDNLRLSFRHYYPLSDSPVINTGANLGPLTDYAGTKTFSTATTSGHGNLIRCAKHADRILA